MRDALLQVFWHCPHCTKRFKTVAVASAQVLQQQDEEGRQRRQVKVALDVLRDMDFGPYMLLHVAQEVLLEYAACDDAALRKAAAVAAWRVTERQWALLRCAPPCLIRWHCYQAQRTASACATEPHSINARERENLKSALEVTMTNLFVRAGS